MKQKKYKKTKMKSTPMGSESPSLLKLMEPRELIITFAWSIVIQGHSRIERDALLHSPGHYLSVRSEGPSSSVESPQIRSAAAKGELCGLTSKL